MPTVPNQNLLLVEGKDEKRVIPEVIEKTGVVWEPAPKSYAVDIEDTDGIETLLDAATLSAYGKRSGLRRLGIVMDGDTDPPGRWQRLRTSLLTAKLATDLDLPASLPSQGLVVTGSFLRLGVWMMPDNVTSGMLETFLSQLVATAEGQKLDQFVQQSTLSALNHGATFKNPTQFAKARIIAGSPGKMSQAGSYTKRCSLGCLMPMHLQGGHSQAGFVRCSSWPDKGTKLRTSKSGACRMKLGGEQLRARNRAYPGQVSRRGRIRSGL